MIFKKGKAVVAKQHEDRYRDVGDEPIMDEIVSLDQDITEEETVTIEETNTTDLSFSTGIGLNTPIPISTTPVSASSSSPPCSSFQYPTPYRRTLHVPPAHLQRPPFPMHRPRRLNDGRWMVSRRRARLRR